MFVGVAHEPVVHEFLGGFLCHFVVAAEFVEGMELPVNVFQYEARGCGGDPEASFTGRHLHVFAAVHGELVAVATALFVRPAHQPVVDEVFCHAGFHVVPFAEFVEGLGLLFCFLGHCWLSPPLDPCLMMFGASNWFSNRKQS